MGETIGTVIVYVSVAAIVAMVARRFKLPYTIGLLAAGVGISFTPSLHELHLTKELLFTLLLPPLIFQAAFVIEWEKLKKDIGVIVTLATIGVGVSASIIAFGARSICSWPWASSWLFAILLSATDPVSVIATFKGSGAKGRLKLLVEAESLFNDGTAASIFAVALAISAPTLSVPLTGLHIVALVFSNFFGGILCGLIVGGITLAFAWRTSDHLIEMTFTTVAAYGSFLLADSLHCSGVISAMCAGLVMGNAGYENTFTEKGKEALEPFWEFIAFVSNSIIFILMGQALTKVHFQPIWRIALEISLLVMIARAVSVVACCAPFVKGKQAVNLKHQTALIWGGLRGALALALAMALPESIPHRSEIIGVVFSVVGFSIIVQGLTMPNLLRKIGETGRTHIH